MLGVGFIASFIAGMLQPSLAVVMGSVTGTFDPRKGQAIDEIMSELLLKILAVALTIWVFSYIQYAFMQ
jgi:ABC-type dipeptide/oligopeptide/nickel transport system permease subunit